MDAPINFRFLTRIALACILPWAICCASLGQDELQSASFFTQRIQPIFVAKCVPCHGPKVQKSSYRLDVRRIAILGGDHGEPPIVPSDVNASLLLQYVSDRDSDLAMPPKDSQHAALTASEIQDISKWIAAGAIWPDSASAEIEDPLDWWSFKPMGKAPLPNSEPNPIDSFVQAKLVQNNLAAAPAADARTLARRLYFDLIGLPPPSKELETFEFEFERDADAALEKLVDRLLAMPEYGERWARHWLDVVHYGDTHGYDKDKPRSNAWPYRDYVIRALNEDKPYSRFVQEQIAGDTLWPNTRDGIEALGFIAAGPWDLIGHAEVPESKTDGKIARHLDRDDMVANTIGTFCSVTIHCAQCHQHKFDPISQEDYYRLQSVFSALDRTDRSYYADESLQKQWTDLTLAKSRVAVELEQIEEPLRKMAGEEYIALTKRIENASKTNPANPNKGAEFGYHSEIAKDQETVKWVQVDLVNVVEIDRVAIIPCYDDFNSIGAGFGFPLRFRVELSDDPSFQKGVQQLVIRGEASSNQDQKNPGLAIVTAEPAKESSISGRYVRVTATKLAPRQNDFIFALAELQVLSRAGVNVAIGGEVTALDSIEAPPRWRKTNLTDGIAPEPITRENKEDLVLAREELLMRTADRMSVVDEATSPSLPNNESIRKRRARLLAQAKEIGVELKKLPPPMQVYAGGVHNGTGTFVGTGANGGKPRPIFILARGQVTQPLGEVSPGSISAFDFRPSEFKLAPDHSEADRRVALANWITDPANPLTWRSIVNRVWQYHFGRGIVDTPNDLGHNGGLPSHPELLDWMATDFRDHGGSIKRLHRMIVMSKTYRQASKSNVDGERVDSGNTLLWRQNRRRLEAEAIRDSVLSVSGTLDRTMGGPGWQDFVVEHPEHSPHYEYRLADPEDTKTWRRSIYRFVVRSQTQPWMTSLDCADPSMRVDKRNESLSAIQALALLNNGFILTQSKHFAKRVESESADIAEQVDIAYRMAFGIGPPEANRQQLIEFTKTNGLPYLCRLLLNLNAFTFVD